MHSCHEIFRVSDFDALTNLASSYDDATSRPSSPTRVLDVRTVEDGPLPGSLVSVLVHFLRRRSTAQLWTDLDHTLFFRLKCRLEQQGHGELLAKVSMHPRDRDDAAAAETATRIERLYDSLRHVDAVRESHPELGHLLKATKAKWTRLKLEEKILKKRKSAIGHPSAEAIKDVKRYKFLAKANERKERAEDVNEEKIEGSIPLVEACLTESMKTRDPNLTVTPPVNMMDSPPITNPPSAVFPAPLNPSDLFPTRPNEDNPRKCYTCCRPITSSARNCSKCQSLNDWTMEAPADLSGRWAVVTGGRIKIGLETALWLLRRGCSVVVTTRFAGSALETYSKMADFGDWRHRLRIVSLDLLDLDSIHTFIDGLLRDLPHLDILVNNAAQTIWRPNRYYAALCEREAALKASPPEGMDAIVDWQRGGAVLRLNESRWDGGYANALPSATSADKTVANVASKSSALDLKIWFPAGATDDHGEPLDARPMNSWKLGVEEVPLPELLQVLAVNAVAPFILVGRLKELLRRSPFDRKFIVNVSAMEGQFARVHKGFQHPHTNMAKAALNMLTRTTGMELQLSKIFMTSVDTGWCTDERPLPQADYERDSRGFVVPLTCRDGAARVVHPILHGLDEAQTPYYAIFLKNYKPFPW